MKKGLFIGLCCLDVLQYLSNDVLINKKQKTNNTIIDVGGPATNAAITYSLLGGKAKLITSIGNSEIGNFIKAELNKYDIEVIDINESIECAANIASIIVNTNTGERTVVSGQPISNTKFNGNDVDVEEILTNSLFCFSDCNLAETSLKFLKIAKEKDICTILDVGSWKDRMEEFLDSGKIIIASNDAKTLDGKDIIEILENDNKLLAITNGARGIKYFDGEVGVLPVDDVDAVDTLGAGDIYHGAFCYMYSFVQKSFVKALEESAIVAASSVKYFGTRKGVAAYIADNCNSNKDK